MRKLVLLLFLFSGTICSASEITDSVGVETIAGEKFIRHKVVSGEGWYSIARKYGISYSEFRMANKKDGDKLAIGQIVLIPAKAKLNDPRFQKNYTDKKPVETVVEKQVITADKAPVTAKKKTHKVVAAETLFSIARTYSITVDQLKKWNNITDNTIEVGQELIVGADNSLSKKDINPTENPLKKNDKKDKVSSEVTKSSPKLVDTTLKESAVAEKKETTIIVKTAGPEKIKSEDKKEDKKYSFANGRQEVNEQGVASWIEDEEINPNKYYALHRTAPIGTIIKVTNRMNSSSVFVKVVGVLQETGDNDGLIIKISKASAERLNVLDKKFQADLVYGLSGK